MTRLLSMGLAACLGACASTPGVRPNPSSLAPFSSDGCTGFVEGTPADPGKWLGPCVRHDLAYWAGGTRADRLAADRELRAAMARAGHPVRAALAYVAVRVCGSPRWDTPWRWGFGWPGRRPYGPLTAAEQARVDELTPEPFDARALFDAVTVNRSPR